MCIYDYESVNTHPEQSGVRCLAQAHLCRGVEGGREHWTFISKPKYYKKKYSHNQQRQQKS